MATKKIKHNPGSGSLSTGEPEYLVVGHLRRPHGLQGEMVMEIHSDFPERLKPGVEVYIGDSYQKILIDGVRFHNEGLLIKFQNIDSPEAAGRYRNHSVFVTAADRPDLPEGQYYHHELLGFTVLDEKNNVIGTLTEIMQTGANDVYVVRQDNGREVLLPVIASVILSIDIEAQQIRVKPLAGLLDGLAE